MQKRRRKEARRPTVSLDQMSQWQHDEIDPAYWEDLIALDPQEVCRRTLASYAPNQEAYFVRLLSRGYTIRPFRRSITREANASSDSHRYGNVSFAEALVLIIYLLRAKEIPLAGKQQTEKDLPGGETFFRGPHELPRQPILKRFCRHPERFLQAGLSLGGERLGFGDAAFRVHALPRIPLDYILWAEDEEFEARVTLAFDATVAEHLPLDVIWALVHLTTGRLVAADSDLP